MHELALTYEPAHRWLYAALEEWELELYGGHIDDPTRGELSKVDLPEDDPIKPRADPETLRRLWNARARFWQWLDPLNLPDLEDDMEKAWLPAKDHHEVKLVDGHINDALEALSNFSESLRISFHSLRLLAAEAQRDRHDVRQRRIEVLATIFLVPTLIVGFYGANTWVPGERAHWGFWIMIVAIVALTSMGTIAVLALHRRDDALQFKLRQALHSPRRQS